MGTVVAITGKGGTGKTTIACLLIRHLLQSGRRPILAVDADPDSNLPEALGIAPDKTISTIGRTREEFFTSRAAVPAGMPKEAYLDLTLHQALIETKDIDLLVMGRPEGAGCYCYINNVLRKHLEMLGKNYPYVIIDNEAGLEHLSRRTAQQVDALVIVSDYSLNGLRAATRIRDLASDMQLSIGSRSLIVNNAPTEIDPRFSQEVADTGIELLGYVPEDSQVPQYDIERRPLVTLAGSSPAAAAADRIAARLLS
jgi:CO dehydrogenase maturation factor